MKVYTVIVVPNAVGYLIRFDNRSCTQSCSPTACDFVSFYTDPLLIQYYENKSYSGCGPSRYNNFNSIYISASTFVVYFQSNSYYSLWGYMLYINPVIKPAAINDSCPSNSTHYRLEQTNSSLINLINNLSICLCNKGYSSSLNSASIVHRYSFRDNSADDSIGFLNGLLMDGAYIVGNQVTLLYSYGSSIKPCISIRGAIRYSKSISFEVWVSTGSSNGGEARLFQFGRSFTSNSNSIAAYRNTLTGGISVKVYNNYNSTYYSVNSVTAFNTLSDAHIVIVLQTTDSVLTKSTLTISIFYNGKLVGSDVTTQFQIPTISSGGYIGRSFLSSDLGSSIIVEEFRIWNGALSANSVLLSFKEGKTRLPCASCPVNTFSNTIGASNCSACPTNSITSTNAAQQCYCKAGYSTRG